MKFFLCALVGIGSIWAQPGGGGLSTLTDAELRQFHVDALFADEHGHWRVVEATVTPVE